MSTPSEIAAAPAAVIDYSAPVDAATEAADVATLESTLFRFASSEDSKLEGHLTRVLPKLLPLFLRPSQPIRDQLMLICNHVNKRLNALPTLQLPVVEFLQLYRAHATESNPNNSFFITFLLMYIEKGFSRLDAKTRVEHAHELLVGIGNRNATHQKTLLHTFFRCMNPSDYHLERLSAEESEKRWKPVRDSTKDQQVLLDFMLDALLWAPVYVPPPPRTGAPALPTVASAAAAAAAASAAEPEVLIPDGLSPAALATLTLDNTLPSSALQSLKASCLHFLNADIFSQNQILPLAIAGSCVGNSDVVHSGESNLKKLKNLDLEDSALINKLFEMYLGTMDNQTIDASKRRKPVSYAIKLKLMYYLSRSKLSVTLVQQALKVVFDTLFAAGSTPKLKNLGLMYLGWFLNNANPQHLSSIAPVLLNTLLKFLANCKTPSSASNAGSSEEDSSSNVSSGLQTSSGIVIGQLRGATYQLIGQLSLKRPDLFNTNLKMMSLFFKALQDENHDVVLQNIHEGLSMLRSSFVGVNSNVQNELQSVLLTMINQGDKRIRLNALQCFNRLFPFQDILARYCCLYLTNDQALEIKDESARGLTPFIPRNELEAEREKQKKKREQERKEEAEKKRREAGEKEEKDASSSSSESKDDAMEDVSSEESPPTSSFATPGSSVSAGVSLPPVIPQDQPNALLAMLRPIEAALVPYPSFGSLTAFAHSHIVAQTAPTADSRLTPAHITNLQYIRANLVFDIRSLPALLDFLFEALKQNAFYAIDGSDVDLNSTTSSSTSSSAGGKKKTASGMTEEEINKAVSKYASKLLASEEAAGVPKESRSLFLFQSLIEFALEQRVHDVQSSAALHLVRLVSLAPSLFAPVYASRLAWVEKNLLSGIQLLRQAMGDLLHLIASRLEPDSIVLNLLNSFLTQIRAAEKIVGPSRDDITHGCILGLGVLLAEALRRNKVAGNTSAFDPALLNTVLLEIAKRMDGATFNRTPHITAAAIISIGRAGEVAPLPLPATNEATAASDAPLGTVVAPTSRHAIVVTLFSMLKGQERKGERVTEESIKTLGLMSIGDSSTELLNQIIDGFFASTNTKHEELHFAIGDTLSVISKHHQFPITAAASGSSQQQSFSLTASVPASSPTQASSSSASTPISIPPETDVLHSILPRLFKLITQGSTLQRTAACTWLLCLVKFAWNLPAIHIYFEKIQAVFTVALTDSNQFVQEVAAKGMSILYEHSTGAVQQELIDALMKTFSSGQRKVTGDTVVALDEEKGEYSTYKELVDVAKSMDKPDLVYNFLDLAAHHSIWSSKLGAAFSLSSILQVNNKLHAQLGSILPKLYRYQFDTNKLIQDSMRKMWLSLVSNPREAINTHFDAIISDLIESMGNRQFRVRNSACLALCELLHGRNMDQLEPYLENLWVFAFRNLDDVNETVRKSATSLASCLSHLSIRLCDTKYSNRASAQKAVNVVIPVLLTQGVTSKAKEIQSVSIRAVLAIIKIGGPNLRPHLATLIGTLLESMSNMEAQVLQYLQFHAQSMQMTEEQVERARLSMAQGGVLADAIASCLLVVDEDSVPTILAKLTDIIGTGIGLPTLTASAKFVVSLSQSKVAPSMKEHIVPLLTQLMRGLSDQSPTLRKVYADAIGWLCKIAKKKRVEKLLTQLIDMYMSDKSNETSRLVSGFALRSIVRQAGDVVRSNFMLEVVPVAFFASHDNTSGQAEIGKVWSETFEELIPGLDAGVVLYVKECAELSRKQLDSQVYALRHIALLSLKHLITACKLRFEPELDVTLAALLKSLPGRLWTGKEVALDALSNLAQECHTKIKPAQARSIMQALGAEAERQKTDYKREAIRCFGKATICFPYLSEQESILLIRPHMQAVVDLTAVSSKDDEKKDSASSSSTAGDAEKKGPDQLLVMNTYAALSELLPSPQAAVTELYVLRTTFDEQSLSQVKEDDWYTVSSNHAEWILTSLLSGLEKGYSWSVRAAILTSLKRFFENIYGGEELAPTTAGNVVAKKSFGPSLVKASFLSAIVAALVKDTALGDPKYPLVRARAIELLQIVADRPALWSTLVADSSIASTLNNKLISMRADTEATVLRLAPPIQTKLAAVLGSTSS